MGEALGRHASTLHPLQSIVADCGGGAKPFVDVSRIELHLSGSLVGVMSPHAGIAVGLQFHPHRQGILR
jgi:hypothetical protein